MKFFYFIPTSVTNTTDTKFLEVIKVPTTLVNILLQDDMAILTEASNTSRFKSVGHNSRWPDLIDLAGDRSVIPCVLLGITVSARIFETGEMRLLKWTSNPDFGNLRLNSFIGAQRTTYNVTAPKNQWGLERQNTVRIGKALYEFFRKNGVIVENITSEERSGIEFP